MKMKHNQQKDYTHLYLLWGIWFCSMMLFVNLGVFRGWNYQFTGRDFLFGNPLRGLIIVSFFSIIPIAFTYASFRKVRNGSKGAGVTKK